LRVLFDQNVPRALGRFLAGHEVTRSAEAGWQELKNGDLIRAAEEGGFNLLVTCDRNLEYQQKVTGRRIAIIALSTNNWPLIRTRTANVLRAVEDAGPGTYLSVDCGAFRKARRQL
jgi:hypothetical protein